MEIYEAINVARAFFRSIDREKERAADSRAGSKASAHRIALEEDSGDRYARVRPRRRRTTAFKRFESARPGHQRFHVPLRSGSPPGGSRATAAGLRSGIRFKVRTLRFDRRNLKTENENQQAKSTVLLHINDLVPRVMNAASNSRFVTLATRIGIGNRHSNVGFENGEQMNRGRKRTIESRRSRIDETRSKIVAREAKMRESPAGPQRQRLHDSKKKRRR